eukprot:3941343-Rhodomonas_salina.2
MTVTRDPFRELGGSQLWPTAVNIGISRVTEPGNTGYPGSTVTQLMPFNDSRRLVLRSRRSRETSLRAYHY